MDTWGWEQLAPWLAARLERPLGPLFCVIDGGLHVDPGTITTHAVHRDCPATIRPARASWGTLTVVGGTGAFEGITGSGRQVNLVYHGEMTL